VDKFTAASSSDSDGSGVVSGASHCNNCPGGKYNAQGDSDCESYVGSCAYGVLTDAAARTKHNQCPGPRGAVKRPYKRFPQ
jgi:hypothetical protein